MHHIPACEDAAAERKSYNNRDSWLVMKRRAKGIWAVNVAEDQTLKQVASVTGTLKNPVAGFRAWSSVKSNSYGKDLDISVLVT